MSNIFVGPKTHDVAKALLGVAEALGVSVEDVKTTTNGFLVTEEIANAYLAAAGMPEGVHGEESGFEDALEPAVVEGEGVVVGEDGIPVLSQTGEPGPNDIVLEGKAVTEPEPEVEVLVEPEPEVAKPAQVKKPAPKAANTKEK